MNDNNSLPSLNSVEIQVIVHEIIKNALQYGNSGLELAKIQTLRQVSEQLSRVEAELGRALANATDKLIDLCKHSTQIHLERGEGLWEWLFGVRPRIAEERARHHVVTLHRQFMVNLMEYADRLMERHMKLLAIQAKAEQQREVAAEQMLQRLLPNTAPTAALPDLSEGEIRVEAIKTTPLRIFRDE